MRNDRKLNTFLNVSYHPPGSDPNLLLNYLSTTVNCITESYPNSAIFICGDFNRMDLEDLEGEDGLVILDSPPTRENARLDLILTNRQEAIDKISTFESSVQTDHLGLHVKPKWRKKPERSICHFRLFSFRGHKRLNNLLSTYNFNALCSIDNI